MNALAEPLVAPLPGVEHVELLVWQDPSDRSYIVDCVTVNTVGWGSTLEEAVENFKDDLIVVVTDALDNDDQVDQLPDLDIADAIVEFMHRCPAYQCLRGNTLCVVIDSGCFQAQATIFVGTAEIFDELQRIVTPVNVAPPSHPRTFRPSVV